MIIVTTSIWLWSEGKGRWHFLTISPERAIEIRLAATAAGPRRGFGSVRVAATIAGVTWRTSLFPQKSGGYILPIKAAVRSRAGIAAGDEVCVTLDLV